MPQMTDFSLLREIGRGDERVCYQHPLDPRRCLKISRLDKKKQTAREISYFRYLKSKGVSFELMPDFYGVVNGIDYIGLEQELILDQEGKTPPNLYAYLSSDLSDLQIERFWTAFNKHEEYLIANNIVVCDLVLSNFLVMECAEETKIYIIDGLGTSDFFPIANYIKFMGKLKITRKWKRFLNGKIIPLLMQRKDSH